MLVSQGHLVEGDPLEVQAVRQGLHHVLRPAPVAPQLVQALQIRELLRPEKPDKVGRVRVGGTLWNQLNLG